MPPVAARGRSRRHDPVRPGGLARGCGQSKGASDTLRLWGLLQLLLWLPRLLRLRPDLRRNGRPLRLPAAKLHGRRQRRGFWWRMPRRLRGVHCRCGDHLRVAGPLLRPDGPRHVGAAGGRALPADAGAEGAGRRVRGAGPRQCGGCVASAAGVGLAGADTCAAGDGRRSARDAGQRGAAVPPARPRRSLRPLRPNGDAGCVAAAPEPGEPELFQRYGLEQQLAVQPALVTPARVGIGRLGGLGPDRGFRAPQSRQTTCASTVAREGDGAPLLVASEGLRQQSMWAHTRMLVRS
mmetsp:Transcript_56159/g.144569  ORF Transcript_56159/g.144569 Transcript_56159/m.144569 type:complete len:294 (+) Transcript_56159:470-1351(+)